MNLLSNTHTKKKYAYIFFFVGLTVHAGLDNRARAAIKISLVRCLYKDPFLSIIDTFLVTTLIDRVLGHPTGFVLFILMTKTFVIN